MPLGLTVASNASSHDCIEVVFVKGYFSSKKQSQGIKLSGIELLTNDLRRTRSICCKKLQKNRMVSKGRRGGCGD